MSDEKSKWQAKMMADRVPLGLYRHYKGGKYRVFANTVDEETGKHLVHYISIERDTQWTRTAENFRSPVDGLFVPRFQLVLANGPADGSVTLT